MKKITLILPFLLLLIVGCDEDATSPDDACVELTTAFSDAVTEYESDVTTANCEAQYTALVAWCDGDCEPSDTATEDSMCTDMTGLDAAMITALCDGGNADEDGDDEDGDDEDVSDEDGDDEDGDDEDGDDEDSDGPPDCYLDCPDVEPLSDFMDNGIGDMTSDEVCEIFVSWDADTCLDDCPSEDLEFLDEVVPLCSACLEAGNCDDLFSDDGE